MNYIETIFNTASDYLVEEKHCSKDTCFYQVRQGRTWSRSKDS
jgi:hypothetical protein